MILVVDCCIRGGDSATRRLYESCLEKLVAGREIRILKLAEENMFPLTAEDIILRDSLVSEGKTEHELLKYAEEFKSAEEIVIAAPYWDLSFPSLLKVYFERVSVSGVTFGYEGSDCVGYCKAGGLSYFSTCGGFTGGRHLGAEYTEALAKMFGIDNFCAYTIEGLDIDPSQRENILNIGIERILKEIENKQKQ